MRRLVTKGLIVWFLLITLLPCYLVTSLYAAAVAAVTTNIRGKVTVLPYKKKVWSTLKVGTYLYEGDTVKTPKRGRAAFTLTNGVELKLSQNTEFGFNVSGAIDKIGSTVRMVSGKVWSNVRTRTKFEIHTPVAIVAVRGTEFGVDYSGGKMGLSVFKGLVNLKNKFGEVNVKAGEKSSVGEGAPPVSPVEMDKEDKSGWQEDMAAKGSLKMETQAAKPVVSVPFEVVVSVYGADDKLDKKANSKISIQSETPVLMFSDNGKSWKDKLSIKAESGAASMFVKSSKAEAGKIVASADNLSAAVLEVSAVEPKEKNLKMKVKTEDGTEELLLQFKKK